MSKIYGVMGHPIQHSLSPEIFHFLAKKLDVPLSYSKMDVGPKNLKNCIMSLKNLGKMGLVGGWNVTIPHKQTVLKCLDGFSPEAQITAAVNVVKVEAGKLRGFNTDVLGVRQTLEEHRVKVRGRNIVILGAGGAASAVAYSLGAMGAARIFVVNRTLKRARKLTQAVGKAFPKSQFLAFPYGERMATQIDVSLLVNATPIGMSGFSASAAGGKGLKEMQRALDQFKYSHGAVGFDLIYRPARTPWIEIMEAYGLRTVGGLDMLIWQAIATWEIWVGPVERPQEIKEALKRHLNGKGIL